MLAIRFCKNVNFGKLKQITCLLVCETRKFLRTSQFYFFVRHARIPLIFSRKAIFVRQTILAKKKTKRLTINPTAHLYYFFYSFSLYIIYPPPPPPKTGRGQKKKNR